MNEKTAQWLRSIKIHQSHINEVQLQNGSLFGLIFEKMNLLKDKKYKNTQDLAMIFQNFKNTKDLLYDNFGIAFPANEIIYRSSQLLQKIKQACEEYERNKKQNKLSEIKRKYLPVNSLNAATISEQKLLTLRQNEIKALNNTNSLNQNRTFSSNEPKLPPKILQIQKKLTKYREQQTRHQLLSLQTRKQQLDTINQAIQDHRYFEMSKLRMTHDMKKEFQKKVIEVVAKTEEKKQERIDKEQQFFRFMKSKKDNFLNSIKQEEQQTFTQGLEDFQLNCLRQGIQLQHDPSKPYQPKEDNFNSKVMLERIKDNIKRLEKQRKERKKRTNSKFVESQEANLKSQQVWEENYLLDRLEKSMAKQEGYVKQTLVRKAGEQATNEEIQLKLKNKKTKPLPEATQQQKEEYEAQVRTNRLIFYDKEIQRLQKKDKTLRSIAEQALQALIYSTIVAEQSETNLNFTYSQWKGLEKAFINYEVTADEKRKKEKSAEILNVKQPKQHEVFQKYLQELVFFQLSTKGHIDSQQKQLAQMVNELIEQAYPKQAQPEQLSVPLYMPLRIGLAGNRLSGKTTVVKKLLNKYPNLVLIDPKKILIEALQLARPAAQVQDSKKKKDLKKPQQETPERVELKKFGQSILLQMKADAGQQQVEPSSDYDSLSFKYILQAIKWKLQQSFKNISHEQVLLKFNQCEEQQRQRIKDFEKGQEEKNKKKDSKKGAPTEALPQSPVFNEYFYTEGFVLDNVQLTAQNLRAIERQLNGFVRMEEKLNERAQRLREELGEILPIQKSAVPDNLNKGFFNILINLDAPIEVQQKRNEGRKMDPQTGQVYHSVFNPVPTEVKGLVERLVEVKKVQLQAQQESEQLRRKREDFYKVFGYDHQKLPVYQDMSSLPLEQMNSQIIRKVEKILGVEYELIKTSKIEQGNADTSAQIKQIQPNKQSQPLQLATQTKSRNHESAQQLLQKFSQLKHSYADSIIEPLSQLPSMRFDFQQSLLQHQRDFLEIITRPDDKANRILNFQDNLNKLLQEKANIINDKSAIAHLIEKLDELHDSLWVNIEAKKNQAIQKRKALIASPWLNSQVQKVVEKAKTVLQAELNYLVDVLSFIIVSQLQQQGKKSDPVIDYLCLGIPKQNQPIQSIISPSSQAKVSPRLEFYLQQVESCLQSLPQWYTKKQAQSKTRLTPQLQQLADNFIYNQSKKLSSTIEYIKELVYSYSQEQMCYFRALINKMDDWIIAGIKDENEFTYSIYKSLKNSIQRITKSNLKDLFPLPITATIKPIERITPFHQSLPLTNNLKESFDYSSYKVFLEEIKCLAFSPNSSHSSDTLKINFTRFQEYSNKRKKSRLLADIYLRLDFDTMQQFLVTDNQANFKEVALAMLFWNLSVLDQETLHNYANELTGSGENQRLMLSKSQQISLSSLLPNKMNISRQQMICLQQLIFDIMHNQYTNQVSIREFIELLGSFNSLQLFKYGDSLM